MMCFERLIKLFWSLKRRSDNEQEEEVRLKAEEEEYVEQQQQQQQQQQHLVEQEAPNRQPQPQPQLIEMQPMAPAAVLVNDLLNSLVGQAVLQCEVMNITEGITQPIGLYFVTTIPDTMRRRLMAMQTQKSTGGNNMGISIASTSRDPSETELRCRMAVCNWGGSIYQSVNKKVVDIELFIKHSVDPTGEGVTRTSLHDVEVRKVLAETKETDTVAELWHGPMQIHLTWHKQSVVIGHHFDLPLPPDRGRDRGLVHIVGAGWTT